MTNYRNDRPQLHIIHDHVEFPGQCLPGEEVIAILLIYRGRRYRIPWGPTHLILADFLCRHRWIALDAWQIAAKMSEDPFALQHGMNAAGYHGRPARTSRTAVRQQIKRMRVALAELIRKYGLDLNAWSIIRSEKTSSGTVRYRVAIDVSTAHWPGSGEESPTIPLLLPIHPNVLGGANSSAFEVQ